MTGSKITNELHRESYSPKSTFIKKIEYSYLPIGKKRITEMVTISFASGMVVEYLCGEGVYFGFKASESVGKYWHKNIKGVYQDKIIRKSNA